MNGYITEGASYYVWATSPYFHEGSAGTIEESIERHQYEEIVIAAFLFEGCNDYISEIIILTAKSRI